jgi:hypothetical protein
MFEFMDSMNQKFLVGKEVRADKTKWWSPPNARCWAFFLNKEVGRVKYAKYFIEVWQGN